MSKKNEARNELLPRVSNLIRFINQEAFGAIPKDNLARASADGIKKHNIIEKNYGKPTNNLLSLLFTEAFKKIFTPLQLAQPPIFEKQLNGGRFTGKPDFILWQTLVDYKFGDDLKPSTALQLVLYVKLILELLGIKIERRFAFHCPEDHTVFIHKVSERALPALNEYADYIIENHEEIEAGGFERFEALLKWDQLIEDYEVFELIDTVMLPLTITNKDEALKAAIVFYNLSAVTDQVKDLKRDLKRYMEETGENWIGNDAGYGVKLENGAPVKLYDTQKKKKAKATYDAALKNCLTSTMPTKRLVRKKPSVKKLK